MENERIGSSLLRHGYLVEGNMSNRSPLCHPPDCLMYVCFFQNYFRFLCVGKTTVKNITQKTFDLNELTFPFRVANDVILPSSKCERRCEIVLNYKDAS